MNKQMRLAVAGFGALALAAIVPLTLAGSGLASSTRMATAPKNVEAPAIYGAAKKGELLRSAHGFWSGTTPITYAYQWRRCDSKGASCFSLGGATSSRYTVASGDSGHTLVIEVTASNNDGKATATSKPTALVPGAPLAAPKNTEAPKISGSTREGQTLTSNNGSWQNAPTKFAYQWLRCDADGNNCAAIAGAAAATYALTSGDTAHLVKVQVTASNSAGSASSTSAGSDIIQPAAPGTGNAIAITSVNPPNRLVIDQVQFSPNPLRSRAPFTARFRVSDSRGLLVSGALVLAVALPYGQVRPAAESPTGADGWATLTLQPTPGLRLKRGKLVFFLRVRKPGEALLAGVSNRRLVQMSVAAP